MVSTNGQDLLYGVRKSSVVPAAVTGEKAVHQLTNLDLALKLHYLRFVFYYTKDAFDGLDIMAVKRPMFNFLDFYSAVAGRFRRSESGRPFIKCNDSGVRIVEGQCNDTLEEWLDTKDGAFYKQLVPDQVLGPEMQFSPLVLIQFTWFKCGGVAVGFSWSHALGDVISALNFINLWGQFMAGTPPTQPIKPPRSTIEKPAKPSNAPTKPLPAKPVEPVGDHWLTASNCKMEAYSFHISNTQLKHIQSKVSGIRPFDAISALIWQCVAKIRGGQEPKIVTVCRNDPHAKRAERLSNNQMISTVKAEFSVADTDVSKLAALIAEGSSDERKEIEEMVNNDTGLPDLIVYGANLTFVDLEEMDFFGLELKGQKPILVHFTIDGVGDEGAVLVTRDLASGKADSGDSYERAVTVILPENQVTQLRNELETGWSIS